MANGLDELHDYVNPNGNDVNVIEKKLPVKVGIGSTIFEVILWICGILPGLIFLFMKIKAGVYLRQLEQKIQANASQIDNYLEQRVIVLSNCAQLVDKSIKLDKEVMIAVAKARGGVKDNDADVARNQTSQDLNVINRGLAMTFERYPDLQSHADIREAMQQNSYLQKEITAARDIYNDSVYQWNKDIQVWPTKMIVAAKNGYTTRVPFSTSFEVKKQARGTFFGDNEEK